MKKNYKYACVGVGKIAEKAHLTEINKIKNVEIAAICDVDQNKAQSVADRFGVDHIYQDYSKMFQKENLDFVSICAPNFLHYDMVLNAMENGLNVICEKPLCMSAIETKHLIDYSIQSGKKLMVRMNNRFTEEAKFTKSYVESGELGEIYFARCGWIRRNGIPGSGTWFTNSSKSGGGCMIDLGVHMLDLVLSFMGYPSMKSVSGAAFSKFSNVKARNRKGYKSDHTGVFDAEDMAAGMIRLDGKKAIDFEFSWAANIEKECKFFELYGSKGGIKKINDENLKVYTEINNALVDITPVIYTTENNQNEFEHFVECLDQDKQPEVSLKEMYQLSNVIDGFYKSSNISREVIL